MIAERALMNVVFAVDIRRYSTADRRRSRPTVDRKRPFGSVQVGTQLLHRDAGLADDQAALRVARDNAVEQLRGKGDPIGDVGGIAKASAGPARNERQREVR